MRKSEFNLPSPLEHLPDFTKGSKKIEVYVKRDDVIHSNISGNKYRKLKYNLPSTLKGVITFGGAFSNHIHALAAATKELGIHSVGIIRGEASYANNPTLLYAQGCGMKLHFVSREDYRLKENSKIINKILSLYPDFTIIPEGGTNELALIGTAEMYEELCEQKIFDYVICAAGTGGTAAGLLRGIEKMGHETKLLVISALKGSFLENEILKLVQPLDALKMTVFNNYHRGGYAKTDDELICFINEFYHEYKILLDPIYNGKVVMALKDLLENEYFNNESSICWIHTGGLQGVTAYNFMARSNKPLIEVP